MPAAAMQAGIAYCAKHSHRAAQVRRPGMTPDLTPATVAMEAGAGAVGAGAGARVSDRAAAWDRLPIVCTACPGAVARSHYTRPIAAWGAHNPGKRLFDGRCSGKVQARPSNRLCTGAPFLRGEKRGRKASLIARWKSKSQKRPWTPPQACPSLWWCCEVC